MRKYVIVSDADYKSTKMGSENSPVAFIKTEVVSNFDKSSYMSQSPVKV